MYNEENYINLLHSDELLCSNLKNIKITEQLKSNPSKPSEQLKLYLSIQLIDIRNSNHQIYEDKNNTAKTVRNEIYISRDKSLNINENEKKQQQQQNKKKTIHTVGPKKNVLLLDIQRWKELMRERKSQVNGLLKSENSQEQPSVTCITT